MQRESKNVDAEVYRKKIYLSAVNEKASRFDSVNNITEKKKIFNEFVGTSESIVNNCNTLLI